MCAAAGRLQGPRLSWSALTGFQKCEEGAAKAAGYSCDIFQNKHPHTIAMSVGGAVGRAMEQAACLHSSCVAGADSRC